MVNAAELEAADHVGGRHDIRIDHAGQLFAWTRLEDLAHTAQSIQSICVRRGGVSTRTAILLHV